MQNWYSSVKLMFIAPPPLARGKALSLVSRGLTAYRYGSTGDIISRLSAKGNRKSFHFPLFTFHFQKQLPARVNFTAPHSNIYKLL